MWELYLLKNDSDITTQTILVWCSMWCYQEHRRSKQWTLSLIVKIVSEKSNMLEKQLHHKVQEKNTEAPMIIFTTFINIWEAIHKNKMKWNIYVNYVWNTSNIGFKSHENQKGNCYIFFPFIFFLHLLLQNNRDARNQGLPL